MVSLKSFLSGSVLYCAVLLLIASTFGVMNLASAQSMPSQSQIEQFKKLPRAQQEALARQYGVDVSMLDSLNGSSSSSPAESQKQQQNNVVFPRGTNFDENGDPIIPEDLEAQFSRESDELKPLVMSCLRGAEKLLTNLLCAGSIQLHYGCGRQY